MFHFNRERKRSTSSQAIINDTVCGFYGTPIMLRFFLERIKSPCFRFFGIENLPMTRLCNEWMTKTNDIYNPALLRTLHIYCMCNIVDSSSNLSDSVVDRSHPLMSMITYLVEHNPRIIVMLKVHTISTKIDQKRYGCAYNVIGFFTDLRRRSP